MARTFSAERVSDVLHELVCRLAARGDTARAVSTLEEAEEVDGPHYTGDALTDGSIDVAEQATSL